MKLIRLSVPLLAASLAFMANAQSDSAKTPPPEMLDTVKKSLLNLPSDMGALEASGIYSMDNISATSVLYATKNFKDVPGAGENLLQAFLANHQYLKTPAKAKIRGAQRKCGELHETFAKKDCTSLLINDFSNYGQKISKARYLNFATSSITSWEEVRQTIKVRNINYLGSAKVDRTCMSNSMCLAVGEYGSGNYLLCYQLEAPLPMGVEIPSSEEKARAVSKLAGPNGIESLQPSLLLQVTEPVKALPSVRMCAEGSRDKIMAVGKAKLMHMVLWSEQQSVYVHDFDGASVSATAVPTGVAVPPLPKVEPLPASTNASPSKPTSGKVILKAN